MPDRRTYYLNDEQDAALVRAMTEAPMILVPGRENEWQQPAADAVWQRIADDLGFDWTTVQPLDPDDRRRFTAVPRI